MKLLQTKHGANSSSGDRLFLTSVPATVGCRVACAPRARIRRRPRVERNKVVPWPTRRGRNMHRHISRRLHPLHASQDAPRPQERVAAEAAAASKQNNKSRRRGRIPKNNIEVFLLSLYIYILLNLYSIRKKSARTLRKWSNSQKKVP